MPIVLALLAAAMAGIGAAMQKHGMATRFPRLSLRTFLSQWRHVLTTLFTNRLWLAGIVVGFGSAIPFVQAMATGRLSVVQPLLATTNVWTVAVGVVILGERLVRLEWWGIAMVVASAALVSVGGADRGDFVPNRPLLYGITAGGLALMAWCAVRTGSERTRLKPELLLAMGAGLAFGLVNTHMKVMTWEAAPAGADFDVISPASWMATLQSPSLYILLVTLVLSGGFLQGAFAHGRVATVNAVVTLFATLLPVGCALLVFREPLSTVLGIGIACSLLGTALLFAASLRSGGEAGPTYRSSSTCT